LPKGGNRCGERLPVLVVDVGAGGKAIIFEKGTPMKDYRAFVEKMKERRKQR